MTAVPGVTFSELSRNSKSVAGRLDRAHRLHITRRDGEDMYLTTARHDRDREETADITARLFAALIGCTARGRGGVRDTHCATVGGRLTPVRVLVVKACTSAPTPGGEASARDP